MDFKQWLTEHDKTKTQFCRESGVKIRSLNMWLNGTAEPLISKFIPFAEHVNRLDPSCDPLSFFPFKGGSISTHNALK